MLGLPGHPERPGPRVFRQDLRPDGIIRLGWADWGQGRRCNQSRDLRFVFGIRDGAYTFYVLDKCSTTELYPSPTTDTKNHYSAIVLRQGPGHGVGEVLSTSLALLEARQRSRACLR